MRYEQTLLAQALNKWGKYEEGLISKSAYPSISMLYRFMREGDAGPARHNGRILSNGTPLDILEVRQAVHQLPEKPQICIKARYIFSLKEDGSIYDGKEKAKLLGYSYEDYNTTLTRARNSLIGLLHLL